MRNIIILDIPFAAEEVVNALSKMKKKKVAGPDGLMADLEHLQEAGIVLAVQIWLRNVLNC